MDDVTQLTPLQLVKKAAADLGRAVGLAAIYPARSCINSAVALLENHDERIARIEKTLREVGTQTDTAR